MVTNDDLYCAILAARLLISEKSSWTRNCVARDDKGHEVHVSDRDAVCWCAGGAVFAVQGGRSIRFPAIRYLERNIGVLLSFYNDTCSHEKVLALFDKAIKELENGNQ